MISTIRDHWDIPNGFLYMQQTKEIAKERNLFIYDAPIRRISDKKLHKVLYLFFKASLKNSIDRLDIAYDI